MPLTVQLWLDTQRYWVRIPAGYNVCHRGCAHTVHQPAPTCSIKCAVMYYVFFEVFDMIMAYSRLRSSFRRDTDMIVKTST